MTERTREILRLEHRGIRRTHLLTALAVLGGLPLWAAYELSRNVTPEIKANAGPLVLAALGVAAFVVLVLASSRLTDDRRVRRDLRASHYLRTTGRLTVRYVDNDEGGGWFHVHLDERKLRSPWGTREPPFVSGMTATVDHTREALVVFAIVDLEGWPIYVAPGYNVPLAAQRSEP
ncbi:MAG: hypothetical protein ABJB39_08945 [Chloroflexota bacterium]